jgi:uncharacterized protein (DUF2126 family)
MDEARLDQLYEDGDRAVPRAGTGRGDAPPPWLVDRLVPAFAGRTSPATHRAEICIDKLFSPDTPTEAAGLVDSLLRNAARRRMSLAQQLTVARAEVRGSGALRNNTDRWCAGGTALHDRFMLGHFIWRDLLDVLED